jgi:hypothetical protein
MLPGFSVTRALVPVFASIRVRVVAVVLFVSEGHLSPATFVT